MEPTRTIKSFVRRKGRLGTLQKLGLSTWLPKFALSVENPFILPEIFGCEAPLVVEIGFGMGHALIEMAQNHPEKNFLGIEVHQAGVGAVATALETQQLTNVRVVMHDAIEVLTRCIPDHVIDEVCIFFPDPWPKKRHHKRRLIQKPLLDLLAKKIKPGGHVHVATDWEHYAMEILACFAAHPHFKNCSETGGFIPRVAGRPRTKFEARSEREGRSVWELMFSVSF